MTDYFNPSISNQMSLTVSSVDNSDAAGGKQRGRLVKNLINKISSEGKRNFPLWFVIFQLYNLGRFYVYASVSKFLGVQILNFKR